MVWDWGSGLSSVARMVALPVSGGGVPVEPDGGGTVAAGGMGGQDAGRRTGEDVPPPLRAAPLPPEVLPARVSVAERLSSLVPRPSRYSLIPGEGGRLGLLWPGAAAAKCRVSRVSVLANLDDAPQ